MSDYTLPPISVEQNDIVQSLSDNYNIMTDSVAGSGKTTSCLHIAKSEYGKSKKILLLTYNSKLKIETRERVHKLGITNMEVHSYHAFNIKYYYPDNFTDEGILITLQQNIKPTKELNYDLILLDEQQDMTYIYFHFVKKIIRDNSVSPQLCLFGDVNQNIYSFKGSDERYLTLSPKIFEDSTSNTWKTCSLRTSYRITKPMETFVNEVLLGNDRIKSIKDGSKVRYVICNSFSSDPFNEIYRYINMGHRPEDIFVLAPSINQKGKNQNPVRKAENRLVDNGIPCFVPGDDNQVIDDDIIRGKLVFSSFHQVKGLERDIVIIFNFDSSYFDYYAKTEPTYKCPNTLYVAVTRAKKYMTILHHKDNTFLPFMKTNNLNRICNVISGGESFKSNNVSDDATVDTSVTELTKHLSSREMDYALGLIKYKVVQEEISKTKIKSKIKTNSRDSGRNRKDDNNNLYESVSDLNGIAIPSLYEYKTNKRMAIFKMVHMEIRKLEDKHKSFVMEFYVKYKNGLVEISDILRLTNIYNFIQTGFKNKLEQIDDYSWLDKADLDKVMINLEKYLSHNSEYELECCSYEPICNRKIKGRIDVYDVVSNTVWELKCVKSLNNEYILQLAIYSYLMEVNKDNRFKPDIIGKLSKLSVKELSLTCSTYNLKSVKDKFKDGQIIGTQNKTKSDMIDELTVMITNLDSVDELIGSRYRYKLLNIMTEEVIEIEYEEENTKLLVEYLVGLKYGVKLVVLDEDFITNCKTYDNKTNYIMKKSNTKINNYVRDDSDEIDFVD